MLTLWGVVIVVSLVLLAITAWLVTRDTPPPPPPGRHRPKRRDLGCVNDLGQFLGLLIRQRWLLDGGR